MKTNNDISNARYYANAAEQQILIQGLQRYFSLPERSQNRNKITKEVSQFLRCFSPHWSHRAVRLWFNNNKHSYFNTQNPSTENANNIPANVPNYNNNIKMNANQNFDPLSQKNANTILSSVSYLQMPQAPLPNQPQPTSIPGIQYPNFTQMSEKGDNRSIQMQGKVFQQTLGAIAPTIQNLIPASILLKDQQQPQKVKQEQNQLPPPKPKQQLIVPQINTVKSVSQINTVKSVPQVAPPQMQSPAMTQPFEVKMPPKIPQPQIQQTLPNSNKSIVSNSTSSIPPARFQRIPTPQIDGTLYSESSSYNNNNPQPSNKSSSNKKVTVMPPINLSPANSSKIPTPTNISYWPNNFDRGSSLDAGPQTRERMCKQITSLLKEIRETPEEPNNPYSLLKMKIDEFEKMCRDYRTQYGFLSPQIIDPSFKFTRFPVNDPLRDMPASLSSLSFSLLSTSNMNDDNDGYGGFMYNDMGSIGSLSAFGRSDSNFSLNTFSPSTSMNLINEPSAGAPSQMQDNSIFNAGRDESLSNFEIFGKNSENNEIKNESPDSSSPSFAPSTSSSIDASMATQSNESTNHQDNNNINNKIVLASNNNNLINGPGNITDGGFIDQITPNNILQSRGFKSTHIPYFECTALSRGLETAAYVYKHIDFNSNQNQRAICFTSRLNCNKNFDDSDYAVDTMHDSWKTIMVDCQSVVESMVVDCDSAWILTNHEIIHSSLWNNQRNNANDNCTQSARIDIPQSSGSRFLSLIGNSGILNGYGVVACFSSSSNLLFVDETNNHEVQTVKTGFSGISCIATLSNDKIVCGVPLNGTVTLVNKNGDEIRSFVGHCGPTLGVHPLFPSGENFETNLFASRADDNTVRVWDIRDRVPLFQITTSLSFVSNSGPTSSNAQLPIENSALSNRNSPPAQQMPSTCPFLNVGGDDQYLMFGLHNQIGVVDIRKDFAKPILGVPTDDYEATSLCYNHELNSVAMFGEVANIASRDSMLFVGNDGHSRKRIFRTYNNFIG
ncbi:hypothetical protein M9Y10_028087 [Tritrichomonas musculus]|uniref:Homeobox domain-containing protein n=1 Tax=Tritrichomonas musculus TaxID=1915356 RepID=A0ABR2KIA8_9EUKA